MSPVDDRIAFETHDGRLAVVAPDGAVRTLATPEEIAKFTKSAAGIRALSPDLVPRWHARRIRRCGERRARRGVLLLALDELHRWEVLLGR